VGTNNHVLDGGPDPPRGRGNFVDRAAHSKAFGVLLRCTQKALTDRDGVRRLTRMGPQ